MKLKNQIYAFTLAIYIASITSGCSRAGIDVEQEIERFHKHRESFETLSKLGCDAREAMNSRFFRYPVDVSGNEPEPARKAFNDMRRQLRSIGLDSVILRRFEGIECSLYVGISGSSFLGEGYNFGYWYQPESLGNYEYTEGFFSSENVEYRDANRVRGEEPVRFSIELTGGWYLQYYRYP